MYISLLTDDYLKPSGRFTRNFIKESREAPAVFKHKGKYYMLSSGCTGWDECGGNRSGGFHHGYMENDR